LAGEPLYWFTYSQSKYIYSPGIEACYFFHDRLGINLGLGVYFQNPDHSRLTNITHEATFGFYNVNLGASTQLFKSDVHSFGLIAGFKFYYGPDYRKVYYYEEEAYYVYFDASSLQPDYGLDLGIFYIYRKFTLLGKWDFARNRFRVGIGYIF
jgi:hypothetical protein